MDNFLPFVHPNRHDIHLHLWHAHIYHSCGHTHAFAFALACIQGSPTYAYTQMVHTISALGTGNTTNIHRYTHIQIHLQKYTHTPTHLKTCTHMYTYTCTYIDGCMQASIHPSIHPYMHTYICTFSVLMYMYHSFMYMLGVYKLLDCKYRDLLSFF